MYHYMQLYGVRKSAPSFSCRIPVSYHTDAYGTGTVLEACKTRLSKHVKKKQRIDLCATLKMCLLCTCIRHFHTDTWSTRKEKPLLTGIISWTQVLRKSKNIQTKTFWKRLKSSCKSNRARVEWGHVAKIYRAITRKRHCWSQCNLVCVYPSAQPSGRVGSGILPPRARAYPILKFEEFSGL